LRHVEKQSPAAFPAFFPSAKLHSRRTLKFTSCQASLDLTTCESCPALRWTPRTLRPWPKQSPLRRSKLNRLHSNNTRRHRLCKRLSRVLPLTI
jgi:hypothetical protein